MATEAAGFYIRPPEGELDNVKDALARMFSAGSASCKVLDAEPDGFHYVEVTAKEESLGKAYNLAIGVASRLGCEIAYPDEQ